MLSSSNAAVSARSTAIVVGVTAVIGCSGLTDVEAPDIVERSELENVEGANALYAGAITLFTAAYNGGGAAFVNSVVSSSGMIADELSNTSVGCQWDDLDTRNAGDLSCTGDPFEMLSRARVNALSALQVIQEVAPAQQSQIGRLFALAGYTEVLLGELFCSGVPLTSVEGGEPVAYGAPLTTVDLFEQAVAEFDSAQAAAADDERFLNLARVGRGRALLNLGRFGDAAQAVAQVPTGFVYSTTHSTIVEPNILNPAFNQGIFTVPDGEGINGLDFRSAGDPRVQTEFLRPGADNQIDVHAWTPVITGGPATPTVLASGIEARLIEAEAALQAGDASWLSILNDLRASAITPTMEPLQDPGAPDARVDLLFRERAFWLFLTAHRHGDMRRLIRQYARQSETVFPTGHYRGSRSYGTDVSIAMPRLSESRNPNYVGCLTDEE